MKWIGRSAVEHILRRNSHAEVAAAVSKCHSFLTSLENTCSRAEVDGKDRSLCVGDQPSTTLA